MIRAENLTKIFGGKKALDSVSVNIGDGSIYGLVGSNGSGKSTLLRLASGVYTADGGSITSDGEKIFDNPKVKSRIAYLGNTLYNRLLEVFPLDYKAKISTMSKGMQRQAALINAIASSPDYLLLDEAFDGLDVVIRKALKGILVDGVTARGMTTVIASHNLRELEDLCDSVGLVHNGHMVLSDEVDKLKGNLHKVQAAFRGVPDVTAFSGLDVIKAERSGSLLQLIVRGDEIQIMNYINRLSPVFSECIEPSLEETFMFELEVNGYDVKSIAE